MIIVVICACLPHYGLLYNTDMFDQKICINVLWSLKESLIYNKDM